MADLIRVEGDKQERKQRMAARMWSLAADPHDRPDIAIKAADWVAKHGYNPLTAALDDAEGGQMRIAKVVIELHSNA